MVKEREAVQTIMEHKIKVLVQSVAQATGAVVGSTPVGGTPAGQALAKDVAALQKLVNASIAALRNAANNSSGASNGNTSSAPLTNGSLGSSGSFQPMPTTPSSISSATFSTTDRYPMPMTMPMPNYSSSANTANPPMTNPAMMRASYPSSAPTATSSATTSMTSQDPFSYRNLLAGGMK